MNVNWTWINTESWKSLLSPCKILRFSCLMNLHSSGTLIELIAGITREFQSNKWSMVSGWKFTRIKCNELQCYMWSDGQPLCKNNGNKVPVRCTMFSNISHELKSLYILTTNCKAFVLQVRSLVLYIRSYCFDIVAPYEYKWTNFIFNVHIDFIK